MNTHLISYDNPEGVEAAWRMMSDGCNPYRVEDDLFLIVSQGRPTTANPGLEAGYPFGVKRRIESP
jgi:hypothetical protein